MQCCAHILWPAVDLHSIVIHFTSVQFKWYFSFCTSPLQQLRPHFPRSNNCLSGSWRHLLSLYFLDFFVHRHFLDVWPDLIVCLNPKLTSTGAKCPIFVAGEDTLFKGPTTIVVAEQPPPRSNVVKTLGFPTSQSTEEFKFKQNNTNINN